MILSNHCPFVKILKEQIAKLVAEYQSKGVGAAGICASSVQTHPQDGPELMAKDATEHGYTFPYLYDESQETAQVPCTSCTCIVTCLHVPWMFCGCIGQLLHFMSCVAFHAYCRAAASLCTDEIIATQPSLMRSCSPAQMLPHASCSLCERSAGVQGNVYTRVLCLRRRGQAAVSRAVRQCAARPRRASHRPRFAQCAGCSVRGQAGAARAA